jgi:hypothetical protein
VVEESEEHRLADVVRVGDAVQVAPLEPGPDDLAELGFGQDDQPPHGALVPLLEGGQEFVEFRRYFVRTPGRRSF